MLDQIIAYLTDAGLTVYDTSVSDQPKYPYVLIEAPATRQRHRRTLSGDVLERLRLTVTIAGTTPKSVRVVAPQVQTLLESYGNAVNVKTRYLNGQSIPVTMDSDHNRKVFFCVDFYQLTITGANNAS